MAEQIQTNTTPVTVIEPSFPAQSIAQPLAVPQNNNFVANNQGLQSGVVIPRAQELGVQSGSLFEPSQPAKPLPEPVPVQVRYKHAILLALKVLALFILLAAMYSLAIIRQTKDVSNDLTLQGNPTITDLGASGLSDKDNLGVNVRTLFQKDVDVQGELTVKGASIFSSDLNVKKSVIFNGSLTVDGSATIGGNLHATNLQVDTIQATSIIGDGADLNNLNASKITQGTLADARLSSNVALLNANQTFTGSNTFSQSTTLTAGLTGTTANLSGTLAVQGNTSLIALALTGGLTGTSADFTGTVSGADAVAANEFVTLGQVSSTLSNAFMQNGNSFGATATLGTNDPQALALRTNGVNRITISPAGLTNIAGYLGLNNAAPGNRLAINSAGTVDVLAQLLLGTGAATNKGFVVQGSTGQSANLQEWQNSAGTVLANVTAGGVINTTVGYQIGATAATGQYLRGNGTNFVGSAIQAADIPAGSGNYIQNQNAGVQTTSNFWISGTGRADTSIITPLLDTATAAVLNVGTTTATGINLGANTTIAAGKSLTANGSALFKNTVNAATTFQIQDSTGIALLNADTTQGTLSVGTYSPTTVWSTAPVTRTDYTTGANPQSVASADVNGDAKPDLAVTNIGADTVSVFMNNGNGTFAPKVDYATGTSPRGVAIADVNGDGKADMVVGNYGANTVSVFLNNGNGTFAPKVDYTAGTHPQYPIIADFNGDGKPDIAVANGTTNSFSVFMNNGNGTFAPKVDYTVSTPAASFWAIAAADLNGDGKVDLAISDSGSSHVVVFLNNGNGTFASGVNYTTGTSPYGLTAVDLNGDGKPDIAVTNTNSDTVSVFMNNGNGTFASKVDYTTTGSNPSNPTSITTPDLNGDAKPDLAISNSATNTVSVLLNNGNGTFAPKVDYTTGSGPFSITSADFNGDGKPDLATASNSSSNMSVMLFGAMTGTTMTQAPAKLAVNAPASVIGQIIQGTAGQTADLLQVRNDLNTTLFSIGATGNVGVRTGTPGAQLQVNAGTVTTIGQIIQGAASQTADLQQWQSSAGTVLAKVNANGSLQVTLVSPGELGSSIQGAASQTANLSQWQSNTGAVLAYVTATGAINTTTGFQYNGTAAAGNYLRGNGANFISTGIQAADLPAGSGNYIRNGTALQTTANFNIQSAAAGSVGGIIRGEASQTADLLQLQNSAGTVLTKITSTGNLTVKASSGQHITVLDPSNTTVFKIDNDGFSQFTKGLEIVGGTYGFALSVSPSSAGNLGIRVVGVASQTADLLQLQNSAASNVLTVGHGTQPVAVAVSGTAGGTILGVTGNKGGNTTGTTGQVAGAGSLVNLTAGAGGDAPVGSTNGNGGSITLQGGAAGAGLGTAGTYGNLLLQTAGGNVGIGTTTPGAKLDVVGGHFRVTNSTSAYYSADTVGALIQSDTTGKPIQIWTRNAGGTLGEKVRIDSEGNVGIGTTNPTYRLAVVGADATESVIANYSTGNVPVLQFLRSNGTAASRTQTLNGDSLFSLRGRGYGSTDFAGSPSVEILGFATENVTSTNNGGALYFRTAANGTTAPTNRVIIDQTGNVGIGTATPSALLQVAGTAQIDGTLNVQGSNTVAGMPYSMINDEATTNYITNPSFEVDTSGWTTFSSGGTVSLARDTTNTMIGVGAMSITASGGSSVQQGAYSNAATAVAGQAWTGSVWAKASVAHVAFVYVYFYDGTGTYLASAYAPASLTTSYQRFSVIGSGPVNTASVKILFANGPSSVASTMYLDGAQLEQKGSLTSYADGSMGPGYAWTGTAHASTSTRTAGFKYLASLQAGASPLTVAANGNVGIGTTSPNSILNIVSGSREIRTFTNSIGTYAGFEFLGTIGHDAALGLSSTATGGRKFRLASYADGTNPGKFIIRDDTASVDRLAIDSSGNVGIGSSAPGSKLDVYSATNAQNGLLFRLLSDVTSIQNTKFAVTADGNVYTDALYNTGGADLAENYQNLDGAKPGDVVVFDDSRTVVKSNEPGQTGLAGIVSTDPGLLLNSRLEKNNANDVPVALSGRVPVNVSVANGVIRKGDYLTSGPAGKALKAVTAGPVIGTAMEDAYTDGTIGVFVSLGSYNPYDGNNIQAQNVATGTLEVSVNALIRGNLTVGGVTALNTVIVTGDAEIRGNLKVVGTIEVANIIVNGKIITRGAAPQAVLGAATGTSDATKNEPAPQVVVTGNDSAGTVSVTSGQTTPVNGVLAEITFAQAFSDGFKVSLTPVNEKALDIRVYVEKTATGFRIVTKDIPTPQTQYMFDYIVIGTAQ